MMSQTNRPLIGSVFERKIGSPSATAWVSPGSTGFPAVQHRSKSTFARGREAQKSSSAYAARSQDVPVVLSTNSKGLVNSPENLTTEPPRDPDEWRQQISDENERKVVSMTDEERDEERRDIIQRFGTGVGDILRRAREARERRAEITNEPPERSSGGNDTVTETEKRIDLPEITFDPPRKSRMRSPHLRPSSPAPALSAPNSRPSSRATRTLRFAELTPDDVHVYESAPPSPRRKTLALPPPPDVSDDSIVRIGDWKGDLRPQKRSSSYSEDRNGNEETRDQPEPEEGTPEYIRRRFFPKAQAHDPSLAWMEPSSSKLAPSSSVYESVRFDLTGTPIDPKVSSSLPTHLGLHHHADGTHAGYTLDDIFLLSRSSVPAQRATMLDILGRIIRKLAKVKNGESQISELRGHEEELRKRAVAAGVEVMNTRGSLGARAVEVMWECIVGWDEDVPDMEGIELKESGTSADIILSLPLEYVLPQITIAFEAAALPRESLWQLLAIVHRLALQTNEIATTIVSTQGLLASIVQTFLLTPIPPDNNSPQPDPFALHVLTTLALSSRLNAKALLDPADALLRFITMLPSTSPYPESLAISLLSATLRLYGVLASYGMYAHIATTASSNFVQLQNYLLSAQCRSSQLIISWTQLLEAWMVCATDPHCTTPSHEILWSQIVGWGWGRDILGLRVLLQEEEPDWPAWTTLWNAEAAWLEGASINGVRNGESERADALHSVRGGFEDGKERAVVHQAITMLRRDFDYLLSAQTPAYLPLQSTANRASTLAAALRLCLACLPPRSDGISTSPPFQLPLSQLSGLCATLVNLPLWSSRVSVAHVRVFRRQLSSLLAFYLKLSRNLPGISDDLWMSQALAVLCRLQPGDEEFAIQVVEDLTGLVTREWMALRGWDVPSVIWGRGGMDSIKPFLVHAPRSYDEGLYIGPICPSSQSIIHATTQRLPSTSSGLGLPFRTDWMLLPLDYLLHSGNSTVFKSFPSSWNASETEVARASLLLAKTTRQVLRQHALVNFTMGLAQTVFGCMKVFMLEHGALHNDADGEVFRDDVVGQLMFDLLSPFSLDAIGSGPTPTLSTTEDSLEEVATAFLSSSTPFYQYYTDFVALYDAISFSHPIFARLLLPPTSMRYPLDYRKYLWNDFSHILRTVRIPFGEAISGDLGEYLWPAETDPQMIGAYHSALVKLPIVGFVRFLAIHHVACNIWPDLQHNVEMEDRANKLMKAVVDQGDGNLVREVVQYRQVRQHPYLLPPHCFEQNGEWKLSRLLFVEKCGGPGFAERLGGLLHIAVS